MAARMLCTVLGLALATPLVAAAATPAVPEAAPQCRAEQGFAGGAEGRRTFLWRPDVLQDVARRLPTDATLQPAWRALQAEADAALQRGPYSVVDKTRLPASGNRHDYMSLGPYWWPDPKRPGGVPYVRRDGHFNPERDGDAFDVTRLEAMSRDVQSLALAYYFSGERRYADKAAQLLRTWFLAPATRMNPNLDHGQSIPGKVAGRAEGVIDAHRLPRVVESIGLLAPSGTLDAQELKGLEQWFGDFAHWMVDSPIGRKEQAARNNHGLYYDMLLTHFALFARDTALARRTAQEAGPRRLASQIAADGSLPHELTRTRSLHYSSWTLDAAFTLADLGQCVGVDLWQYRDGDSGRLHAAARFLAGTAVPPARWPYPELDLDDTQDLLEVMLRAEQRWPGEGFGAAARQLAPQHPADLLWLRSAALPATP
ncbi:alginate lyase family protein [Stenotrophomonas sp. 24(2023)]|uniref:alginate lyase family protein n=1 Tax=Stenotrophomonas sp. 24(2023) TaxID=3068324 RepID=UPI0027E0C3E6|nr:alginate lyase family protein [Stenotrophomonas sp. 24(2023)]WMJ71121.1 alginate lyase family protein [Stenotrophomonas sp. 24(2023)]